MIIEVLKYPTTALGAYGNEDVFGGPTKLLLGKLGDASRNKAALASADLTDAVVWVAEHYPGIDLVNPPERPAPLAEAADAALTSESGIDLGAPERPRFP
ncbi:MAG: hypothetical protein M3324_07345 [Actinomycetota bacterium]|nr:hypothetical protein [Actinomycetota bacterium]